MADDNEIIIIDPYAGWAEAGSTIEVGMSVLSQPFNFVNTTLQLDAGYENFTIPVYFGLTLDVDDEPIDIIPIKNTLHQNYPNPFNPITTLRYNVPEKILVRISIFDISGNLIKMLVNDVKNAGFYSAEWGAINDNGQPLSTGVYFYKIKAGNFVDTKKMILLK